MPLFSQTQTLVRSANLAALIGDSRAKNYYIATMSGKSSQHPLTWAGAYLGQRLRVIYNGGISGNRSDQWQTASSPVPGYTTQNNVAAMLTTTALWAFFFGIAVNDIAAGYTANQIWNGFNGAPGMKATLDSVAAAGMRAVVVEEIGSTSFDATRIGHMHTLNRYLREWVQAHPGAIYFPQGGLVWSATTTSTVAFKSGYSADGTHLLAKGAEAVGTALAALLSPFVPAFDERIVNANETLAQGGVQLCPNPLFQTTTGGTSNSGITGTSPASVTTSRNGAGTSATVSVISDPNGFGNAFQVAATLGASGDSVTVNLTVTGETWVAGATYFAQARVEVANGSSNALPPWLRLQVNYDSSSTQETFDMYHATSFAAGPTTAYALDLKTDRNTIPAFTTGVDSVSIQVRITATGAGSQTITISRVSVVKVMN